MSKLKLKRVSLTRTPGWWMVWVTRTEGDLVFSLRKGLPHAASEREWAIKVGMQADDLTLARSRTWLAQNDLGRASFLTRRAAIQAIKQEVSSHDG